MARRRLTAAVAPVLEFKTIPATPPQAKFDFFVATSAKAIAFATPGTLAPALGRPLYVVGETTAAAARAAGLTPHPAAEDIASLVPTLPPGRALYLAGRDRKPDLERALDGRIAVMEIYAAEARAGWDETEARAVAGARAALHYSARAASLALTLAASAGISRAFLRLPHVCLSREVAAPLAAAGAAHIMWPHHPAEDYLLDTLESALADRR